MHRCECCSEIEELQRRLRAQEKTLYRQLNIIDRLAKSVPMQVSTCSDLNINWPAMKNHKSSSGSPKCMVTSEDAPLTRSVLSESLTQCFMHTDLVSNHVSREDSGVRVRKLNRGW